VHGRLIAERLDRVRAATGVEQRMVDRAGDLLGG